MKKHNQLTDSSDVIHNEIINQGFDGFVEIELLDRCINKILSETKSYQGKSIQNIIKNRIRMVSNYEIC